MGRYAGYSFNNEPFRIPRGGWRVARESVATRPRWRNIFNGGCLDDWSTTRLHCSYQTHSFPPPCPLSPPLSSSTPLFCHLFFWDNLWKRSGEISRSWHFWIFHGRLDGISGIMIFDKLWIALMRILVGEGVGIPFIKILTIKDCSNVFKIEETL